MALTKWCEGGETEQKAQGERVGCTGLAVALYGGVSSGGLARNPLNWG